MKENKQEKGEEGDKQGDTAKKKYLDRKTVSFDKHKGKEKKMKLMIKNEL